MEESAVTQFHLSMNLDETLSLHDGSVQFLILTCTLIPSFFFQFYKPLLKTSMAINVFEKLLFTRKQEIPFCTNVCAPNA